MLNLGLLIGSYGYAIFILGLTYTLSYQSIMTITLAFIVLLIIFFIYQSQSFYSTFTFNTSPFIVSSMLIITFLTGIAILGALSPETAFDALWYHLTLPKLYLLNKGLSFFSGGLLYYSGMPQLGEMYYIPALLFTNEIGAKFVHFLFGIGGCIVLYSISRKFLTKQLSILVVLIYYSNLVVSWESTTAYIDLIRTFWELLSFLAFSSYLQTKKIRDLVLLGVFLGFAISTKLIALGSLFIFCLLLFIYLREKSMAKIRLISIIGLVVSIVVGPWLIRSWAFTGNPFYPFFTDIYPLSSGSEILSSVAFLSDFIKIFLFSSDPLSPIYIIMLPLIYSVYSCFSKREKIIFVFCILSYLIWYITPRTGGGRFILPYLPFFSLLVGILLQYLDRNIKYVSIGIIFIIALTTLFYRSIAVGEYIPYLIGQESKHEFLSNNLNFAFGDFYDTELFLLRTIKADEKVLIIGSHNLYYVNIPFIHESYRAPDDIFEYIVTQNANLPAEFKSWEKIYENKRTDIIVYKK